MPNNEDRPLMSLRAAGYGGIVILEEHPDESYDDDEHHIATAVFTGSGARVVMRFWDAAEFEDDESADDASAKVIVGGIVIAEYDLYGIYDIGGEAVGESMADGGWQYAYALLTHHVTGEAMTTSQVDEMGEGDDDDFIPHAFIPDDYPLNIDAIGVLPLDEAQDLLEAVWDLKAPKTMSPPPSHVPVGVLMLSPDGTKIEMVEGTRSQATGEISIGNGLIEWDE